MSWLARLLGIDALRQELAVANERYRELAGQLLSERAGAQELLKAERDYHQQILGGERAAWNIERQKLLDLLLQKEGLPALNQPTEPPPVSPEQMTAMQRARLEAEREESEWQQYRTIEEERLSRLDRPLQGIKQNYSENGGDKAMG